MADTLPGGPNFGDQEPLVYNVNALSSEIIERNKLETDTEGLFRAEVWSDPTDLIDYELFVSYAPDGGYFYSLHAHHIVDGGDVLACTYGPLNAIYFAVAKNEYELCETDVQKRQAVQEILLSAPQVEVMPEVKETKEMRNEFWNIAGRFALQHLMADQKMAELVYHLQWIPNEESGPTYDQLYHNLRAGCIYLPPETLAWAITDLLSRQQHNRIELDYKPNQQF